MTILYCTLGVSMQVILALAFFIVIGVATSFLKKKYKAFIILFLVLLPFMFIYSLEHIYMPIFESDIKDAPMIGVLYVTFAIPSAIIGVISYFLGIKFLKKSIDHV
ncbi:MAG: hypothetical protein ACI93P_002753 [bacterium]|jgi:hypothetical protein